MPNTVYVVIGCDADPDRVSYVPRASAKQLSWQGIDHGIPTAKEKLDELTDDMGHSPILTWCVRLDHQIKQLCGSYNFCLNEFGKLFLELESSGDELAWHPHFWQFDASRQTWYQEYRDIDWQVKMLREAFAAYQQILPKRGLSVHMGWTYHNNRTLGTLSELGVKVDFSALPGLEIRPPSRGQIGSNYFDWSVAPDLPYFPAKNDYRRPGNGEKLTTCEVPCFVSRSVLWGTGGNLFLAFKMRDLRIALNAIRRPTYLINITGKPKLFAPLLDRLRTEMKKRQSVIFATYFHADELVVKNHPLYSLEYFKTNLVSLRYIVNNAGFRFAYIRAIDSLQHLDNITA